MIKLCECGCGEPTTVSTYTDPRYGYTKGAPRRFLNGHNVRVRETPVSETAREKIRQTKTGHALSAATKLKISRSRQGQKLSIAHRAKVRAAVRSRIASLTFSPYVPDLVVRFEPRWGRWFCHHPQKRGTTPHARVVYAHYFGEIPKDMQVHHRDGETHRIEDDRPDNLMLLTRIWNMHYIPVLVSGFGTTSARVTELYVRLSQQGQSDQEVFAAICRELLRVEEMS